jgi:lipid-A-disaccharide synthase-like uncharacterized protein
MAQGGWAVVDLPALDRQMNNSLVVVIFFAFMILNGEDCLSTFLNRRDVVHLK